MIPEIYFHAHAFKNKRITMTVYFRRVLQRRVHVTTRKIKVMI